MRFKLILRRSEILLFSPPHMYTHTHTHAPTGTRCINGDGASPQPHKWDVRIVLLTAVADSWNKQSGGKTLKTRRGERSTPHTAKPKEQCVQYVLVIDVWLSHGVFFFFFFFLPCVKVSAKSCHSYSRCSCSFLVSLPPSCPLLVILELQCARLDCTSCMASSAVTAEVAIHVPLWLDAWKLWYYVCVTTSISSVVFAPLLTMKSTSCLAQS